MSNKVSPQFSIVIPTFNHGHLIRKCLDSLLDQTFTNWEAIIVNNFSSDNTIQVIESYNDPRFKLINFSNKGIIAASRNVGIKNANAEWICFLDSDDWWYPEKLLNCCKYLKDYDLIYHNLDKYSTESNEILELVKGAGSKNNYYDLLYFGNRIPNSSVVVKKELIIKVGGLLEDIKTVAIEDYILWVNISKISNKFLFLNSSLGGYLIHNNISIDLNKMIAKEIYFIKKYIAQTNQNSILTIRYYLWARKFLLQDNKTLSVEFFKKSILAGSVSLRPLLYKLKSIFYLFYLTIK